LPLKTGDPPDAEPSRSVYIGSRSSDGRSKKGVDKREPIRPWTRLLATDWKTVGLISPWDEWVPFHLREAKSRPRT
jgi:hypothetical protein